jgi:hypothetical protein
MGNGLRKIALILLILISIVLIFPNGIAQNEDDEDCHVCHGTDGDYTYQGLMVKSTTPRIINPGESFEHTVVLDHPGSYTANSVNVKLNIDSAPNMFLIGADSFDIESFSDGKKTVKFNLRAFESYQPQIVRTIVTYTADYHYKPTDYTEILDISISIDRILLSPSAWSINLKDGDEKEITFTVIESAKNIHLITTSSLDNVIKIMDPIPDKITKGNTFSIKIKAKSVGSGKLNLVYEDVEGKPHKVTLDVEVSEDLSKRGESWVLLGMVGGLLSWSLLIVMTIIGAPFKSMKTFFNKYLVSAAVRNKLHCWVCYVLLFLALFHAIVVMTHHWNAVMLSNSFIFADPSVDYGNYINLGTISWILMIVVSVTGIFIKPLAKAIKYINWRWTHNILTISALAISLTHGLIFLEYRFF